tara:strand:+ start:498 stop:1820 length:1323 start_codon:yes stop_codon:yes gene_type:complete
MHKKQQDRKARKNFTPELFERFFRRNEGTTDYATIPTVTLSGDFVIEFDALAVDAGVAGVLVGSGANTNNNIFISSRDISIRDNNGTTISTSGDVFPSQVLNHVRVQKVGSALDITVNGVTSGSGTSTGSFIVDQLYTRLSGLLSLSGILANLRIYDNGTLIRDYPLDDNTDILRNRVATVGAEIVHGVLDNTFINIGSTTLSASGTGSKTTDWIDVSVGNDFLILPNGTSTRSVWQYTTDGGSTVFYGAGNLSGGSGSASANGLITPPANATHIRIYFRIGSTDLATDISIRQADGYGTVINGTADQWALYQQQVAGEYLGPELVVNGGFDTDLSGWTQSAADTWVWDNGVARHTGAGSNIRSDSLTVGIAYRVSALLDITTGTMQIYAGLGSPQGLENVAGVYTYDAVATTDGIIYITTGADSNGVDNVSAKEVLSVA